LLSYNRQLEVYLESVLNEKISEQIIELRPHHGICFQFYEGYIVLS